MNNLFITFITIISIFTLLMFGFGIAYVVNGGSAIFLAGAIIFCFGTFALTLALVPYKTSERKIEYNSISLANQKDTVFVTINTNDNYYMIALNKNEIQYDSENKNTIILYVNDYVFGHDTVKKAVLPLNN